MRERGGHTGEDVEENIARVPHRILDVVTEDPEVEHVADQMHEPAVKKHAREDAQDGRDRCYARRESALTQDHRGDRTELIDKNFFLSRTQR